MTQSGTDRPTCDHRNHDDPVPAVAQFEGCHPSGSPTFRFWACPEHEPGGPALKRIDAGQGNRSVHTDTDRGDADGA